MNKRYLLFRILRSIVSIFLVTTITYVLIYTLVPRNTIFKEDSTYSKLKAHPDESKYTNDDESHFPASADSDALEIFGQQRNCGRSYEGSDRCSRIENGSGECPVFLREVFSCHLDCCREVSSLSESEDASCRKEEPYARGSYGKCGSASCFDG